MVGMMEKCVEEFAKIELPHQGNAVYLLLLEGRVVYAGKSTNVFSRLGNHMGTMKRGRPAAIAVGKTDALVKVIQFDEVRIRPVAKKDLDKEELKLIQRYKPQHNVLLNRDPPLPGIINLPCVQEFIRKEEKIQAGMKVARRKVLPSAVMAVERSFRSTRDRRIKVTLPTLVCLEAEVA